MMEISSVKSTLLIVDDIPGNLHTLMNTLGDNYRFITAKSGEQALKKLQGEIVPDLILLDIVMPGMDGYELCKKIKANERTKNIPVIFVTSVSEIEDAARGFQAGAVDYIEKPLNPVMVKARVELHIQLSNAMKDLKKALSKVKTLSGFLPICSHCKKIRDDKGYWNQIESYIHNHSDAEFSHGICPACARKYYPDIDFSEY